MQTNLKVGDMFEPFCVPTLFHGFFPDKPG